MGRAETDLLQLGRRDAGENGDSDQGRPRAAERVAEILTDVNLPDLPSLDDLRRRAREMAVSTPSLDEVVERAREIVIETVSACLLEDAGFVPAR